MATSMKTRTNWILPVALLVILSASSAHAEPMEECGVQEGGTPLEVIGSQGTGGAFLVTGQQVGSGESDFWSVPLLGSQTIKVSIVQTGWDVQALDVQILLYEEGGCMNAPALAHVEPLGPYGTTASLRVAQAGLHVIAVTNHDPGGISYQMTGSILPTNAPVEPGDPLKNLPELPHPPTLPPIDAIDPD